MVQFIVIIQPLLYTLLGALIALESGFIHHRYKTKIEREEEDRKLLIEIETLLLDYYAETINENVLILKKIANAAIRIRDKKLFNLSLALTQFAFDKSYRENNTLDSLTTAVQKIINPKLVKKYKSMDRL